MKPFEPYIALSPVINSTAFDLAVLIQIPAGHQRLRTDIYMEEIEEELADIVEFHLVPFTGSPEITIDESFTMHRNQDQSLVLVRVYVDEGTRPNPRGSSAGHYGDPT
jgi:hypothetical protein